MKKHRPAILSLCPMYAFGPGWRMVDQEQKNTSLYIYSGEVKEMGVFMEFGGFFGNIFLRGRWQCRLLRKPANWMVDDHVSRGWLQRMMLQIPQRKGNAAARWKKMGAPPVTVRK